MFTVLRPATRPATASAAAALGTGAHPAGSAALVADTPGTPGARTAEPRNRPAAAFSPDREETLVRARNGDSTAFSALVKQHQSMVFSVALHALRSRAAAEDLAQEVFLELYRSLGRIESAAHATSWLRRVTSHRCIDEIRRRQHRPELGMDVLPEHGAAPAAREFFLEDRLQSLVATLPARARMVVVLRFQEDLDPSEIALALNMPINTVKSHLRRSLNVLRARLSAQG
jgi:RNA polymerase sigma-70 factor, ECF subfamily